MMENILAESNSNWIWLVFAQSAYALAGEKSIPFPGCVNKYFPMLTYRHFSNISRTLVDNKFVDHSDVFGSSPLGATPTTPSFST